MSYKINQIKFVETDEQRKAMDKVLPLTRDKTTRR